MQYQSCDGEEEFEPRVVPKPVTKIDCFAVPIVPEISLIYEKPTATDLNDGNIDLSSARTTKSLISDSTKVNNSISYDPNSYAAWKKQNYYREVGFTNVKHVSPIHNDINNHNHTVLLDLQNVPIQKQQKQAILNDKQKKLQNVNKNDERYEKNVKFKSDTNANQSYLASNKTQSSLDFLPKTMFGVNDHTVEIPNNDSSDTLKKSICEIETETEPENVQAAHVEYQQIHRSNYSNCSIDNNEMVKSLLQLVNSQNEQIKNLQLQVDRLVRLQEEHFQNKSTCLCSQSLANQVFRYPINCYDTTLSSSISQIQNRDLKKSATSQNASALKEQVLENINENNNKLETASLEQQSAKAFMEQKVSIGVMTSFEFTVQNNPFIIDSEICDKKDACKESTNINRTNTVNIHDTIEPVNRYKNTFSRKSGTIQLENIVEDSESYLSSSQQQSSNFNASSSAKESSKIYQHLLTNLNQGEMPKGICIKKSNADEQERNTKKILHISTNEDNGPNGSTNYNKAKQTIVNFSVEKDEKKSCEGNIDQYSLHDIHLPECYHNYRNKEYSANIRQIKDIGDSITLSGGDLKISERPPPTPEPSIHVEMQEYMSDDESDKLKYTSKIGWTLYNNVLGQVNEILQNSSVISDKNLNHAERTHNMEQGNNAETKVAFNTVKTATLEQLRKLGISLTESNQLKESKDNRTLDFDSSFYPRLDHQANMTNASSAVNETNTSMHMKALALKYLSDEQLADIAWHKQEPSSSLKQFMLSNMQGTNMSLATMRYLERYQLLPGKTNADMKNAEQIRDKGLSPKQDFKLVAASNNSAALYRHPLVQTSGTTCPSKILDLSTLKRQPKLL